MPKRRTVLTATSAAFLALVATALGPTVPLASGQPTRSGTATDYLVLFRGTAADSAALKAIRFAGGTITERSDKVGYAYVRSTNVRFASELNASGTVRGTAEERVIGRAPTLRHARNADVEKLLAERASAAGRTVAPKVKHGKKGAVTPEPLAGLQWDMQQIGATATKSYAVNPGKKGVLVGIIDTGIDGSHPDIAPNFSAALSRNFVTDMPDIDGPCEHPSCVDPADEDDDGHGTHVASTIGSPINGLGIAGVAPNVTLVNIRAGQDSGYFFLKATLDALIYAGDIGVDVVNMSFYTDPWLFNCVDNPADSPAEQAEQRTIREATQRAINYATHRGVLPVSALGNEATDLNNPTSDDTSPDYPADAAKDRVINNSCITVPTESRGVVGVSALGYSGRKAYYSNWGTEQTDVSAPGGDAYDTADHKLDYSKLILAAYPQRLAELNGELNPDGTPNVPYVVRDCEKGVCAYYQYLQGTSMASPHAAGVAALVVSAHGKRDRWHGGLTLPASVTRAWLYRTAEKHACPDPRLYHYTRIRPTGEVIESDAYCAGGRGKNGFYGRGIVNAYAAVKHRH